MIERGESECVGGCIHSDSRSIITGNDGRVVACASPVIIV